MALILLINNVMKSAIILILVFGFYSFPVISACFDEDDALIYGCQRSQISQLDNICQEKYGESVFDYRLSNSCSQSRSVYFLEDEVDLNEFAAIENSGHVKATCLTFEQSQKYQCEYFDYVPAQNYCNKVYGYKYIPFYQSKNCNEELADSLYGYQNPLKLIKDLEGKISKVNALLTLIDRESIKEYLGANATSTPVIGNSFYTESMNRIIELMLELKVELEKRSHWNVKMLLDSQETSDKKHPVNQFRNFLIQYISMMMRINKVYAYVAHQNDHQMFNYSFEKLKMLDITLGLAWAKELLSKVQLYPVEGLVKDTLKFSLSEQDYQMIEYKGIENPTSKVEYSKLVKFLTLRDYIVNLWALDRIVPDDLIEHKSFNLGNFLSFRRKNSRQSLKNVNAIKQLVNYDKLFNFYLQSLNELAEKLKDVKILSETKKSLDDIESLFEKARWPILLLENGVNGFKRESLRDYIEQDLKNLQNLELSYIDQVQLSDLQNIFVAPDEIENIQKLSSKIALKVYEFRKKLLVNFYVGDYRWANDEELISFEKSLNEIFDTHHKETFVLLVKKEVLAYLTRVFDAQYMQEVSYNQKMDQTVEAVKKGVRGAYSLLSLDFDLTHMQRISVEPASMQELQQFFQYKIGRRYQDVQLTMEKNVKFASMINKFFEDIVKKYTDEFSQIKPESIEYKEGHSVRANSIREFVVDRAYQYLEENGIDLAEGIPEQTILAQDRKLIESAYHIQVYRDGTPVTMHIDDFYKTFQEDLGMRVEEFNYGVGLDYLLGNFPELTQGQIDEFNQSYILNTPNEVVLSENLISPSALKTLYYRSLLLTKSEIAESINIVKEQEAQIKDNSEEIIRDEKEFFSKVFAALNIDIEKRKSLNLTKKFLVKRDEKKFMSKAFADNGYSASAMLKNKMTSTEIITEETIVNNGLGITMPIQKTKSIERSLLEKIALEAYDHKTDAIDEEKVRLMIDQAIDHAVKNIDDKLETIAKANYQNYNGDEKFKQVFRAASFVRENLRSQVGTSLVNAKKIRVFDASISKEIRTWHEKINEDYLDSMLLWLGVAAIAALGVVLFVASFGASAGVAMMSISALATGFMTMEFWLSFPLVLLSSYARINSNFIHLPDQLSFQKSLAQSQIDNSIVVSWEEYDDKAKAMKTGQAMNLAAILPMELFYGGMVVRQIYRATGKPGVKAYQRLTGVKLSGVRPLPSNSDSILSRGPVSRLSFMKVPRQILRRSVDRIKTSLPRYQEINPELLKTPALRMGLVRKFNELRLSQKPWAILDDITTYNQGLKDRLTLFQRFSKDSDRLLTHGTVEGLKIKEIMEFGYKYSRMAFSPRSLWKKLEKDKLLFNISEYWTTRKDRLLKLRKIQGRLIYNRSIKIDEIIEKVKDFKSINNNEIIDPELSHKFLNIFTDDELRLLEVIAKSSSGEFKSFKKVFKDYQTVLETLRIAQYSVGNTGVRYLNINQANKDPLLDEGIIAPAIKNNDNEDIVAFYENVLRQNQVNNDEFNRLKELMEDELSQMFIIDSRGNRIYY